MNLLLKSQSSDCWTQILSFRTKRQLKAAIFRLTLIQRYSNCSSYPDHWIISCYYHVHIGINFICHFLRKFALWLLYDLILRTKRSVCNHSNVPIILSEKLLTSIVQSSLTHRWMSPSERQSSSRYCSESLLWSTVRQALERQPRSSKSSGSASSEVRRWVRRNAWAVFYCPWPMVEHVSQTCLLAIKDLFVPCNEGVF